MIHIYYLNTFFIPKVSLADIVSFAGAEALESAGKFSYFLPHDLNITIYITYKYFAFKCYKSLYTNYLIGCDRITVQIGREDAKSANQKAKPINWSSGG